MSSPRARLEIALQQAEPSQAVCELATALRDEGMSQIEMYRLYDEYCAKHKDDADETMFDAILDTMDYISGWCSPSSRLYDTQLPPNAA